MTDEHTFYISIPSDPDGFVLLKCPSCSETFKLTVEDIEDESKLDIWCPGCGLPHESYMTDEVQESAERIIENYVTDSINFFMKDLGASLKGSKNIRFDSGKKIKKEPELPIGRQTGDFILKHYRCCYEEGQISNFRKFVGGYCPFCGGMVDGD